MVYTIKENFEKQGVLEPREIDNKYETKIDGLGQNNNKNYIGRFFDVSGTDLAIWAGYDPNTAYSCKV